MQQKCANLNSKVLIWFEGIHQYSIVVSWLPVSTGTRPILAGEKFEYSENKTVLYND